MKGKNNLARYLFSVKFDFSEILTKYYKVLLYRCNLNALMSLQKPAQNSIIGRIQAIISIISTIIISGLFSFEGAKV